MPVNVRSILAKYTPALGLEVAWSDSQFVLVVTDKGLVACWVVDKEVMERASAAIAIARGTREHPLVTVEDLMNAKIADVTSKAAAYGVQTGMSGCEALDTLSD